MCLRRYNGERYENATDPVPLDLQDAMAEVRTKMNDLCKRYDREEQIVTDKEVYIQVVARQFPPLNLIDLPGVVRAKGPDDKRYKLEQATKDLFDRYSGLANSLFLCVVSSQDPLDRWESVHFIPRELQRQALGLVTKCDKMTVQEAPQLASWLQGTAQDLVPLGHGYVAISAYHPSCNMDLSEQSHEDIHRIDEEEKAKFRQLLCKDKYPTFYKIDSTVPMLTTITHVRSALRKAYNRQVFDRWLPDAVFSILETWRDKALIFDLFFGKHDSKDVDGALRMLKEKMLRELRTRWDPLKSELAQIMKDYLEELERMEIRCPPEALDQLESSHQRDAQRKLSELIEKLKADARTRLEADNDALERSAGNVLPKLWSQCSKCRNELIKIFDTELMMQILQKPRDVAWWATNPKSRKAASEAFLNSVMQKIGRTEIFEKEVRDCHQGLKGHMANCDTALEGLQTMYKDNSPWPWNYDFTLRGLPALRLGLTIENMPKGSEGCCRNFLCKATEGVDLSKELKILLELLEKYVGLAVTADDVVHAAVQLNHRLKYMLSTVRDDKTSLEDLSIFKLTFDSLDPYWSSRADAEELLKALMAHGCDVELQSSFQ
eukprot:Skav209205  [mRNA]  locus=scaffold2666:103069:106832:- [translate_table: standard]